MRHPLLTACAVLVSFAITAPPAARAAEPQVATIVEGRDSRTDRPVLVLVGKKVGKFKTFALVDGEGNDAGPVERSYKSAAMIALRLPGALEPGTYTLRVTFGKAGSQTHEVKVANGTQLPMSVTGGSLEEALRSDLNDAETLGGNAPDFYRDASNLDVGTVGTDLFSAWQDLTDEGRVGTGSDQAAYGDHDHGDTYFTRSTLREPGMFNDVANPVDWTKLKGVPTDVLDGTAHTHDTLYSRSTDLATAGTINTSENPVDWTRLKGVPADLADGGDADTTYTAGTNVDLTGTAFSVPTFPWSSLTGVPADLTDGDADTTYSAGAGLSLTGSVFSTLFAGAGTATTSARSDHAHSTDYVSNAGDTMTGALTINAGTAAFGLKGTVTSTSGDGISGYATSTLGSPNGVFGSSSAQYGRGVKGVSTSNSGFGVFGDTTATTGLVTGVRGNTVSTQGTGVSGYAGATSGGTFGVRGTVQSPAGKAVYGDATSSTGTNVGVYGTTNSSGGRGVYARAAASGSSSAALIAEHYSSAGTGMIAQFLDRGTQRAVFEKDGGVLLGGAYTSSTSSQTIPTTGSGTRLMWYPEKASIRAGYVAGTQWDDSNVGTYSTAFGNSAVAAGARTVAMGSYTSALGIASVALNEATTATGVRTTAMGHNTNAEAYASVVIGRYNITNASYNQGGWTSTDPLFVCGNGSSTTSRSNAFIVYKNGTARVGGVTVTSDAQLKRDIEEIQDVLPKLAAIRAVRYQFTDQEQHPAGPQLGMLAQEVRDVFPELVAESADGMLSLDYMSFTAVLLGAVKEQQTELDEKERRIDDLEERLARLEALSQGR